jgi:hypothetical protein
MLMVHQSEIQGGRCGSQVCEGRRGELCTGDVEGRPGEADLERVQDLEELLEIEERWTTALLKWTATVNEIKKRKYHLTLDVLELLIVKRIFELTKMNQSQTGERVHSHRRS